ncbi:glutathione S-transferase family protein [Sphingosinicella soli]|uniref:Glutathione S-transferase n=1 Tax=Sphingosinicella soli TaxID=333708 RepID=A0A7W7F6C2_9SPHN|nr:glutathione S-transferase N-terminal domain-containing protein [Sphingosinicella soli]MBB4631417.1 glutathione S-transferase [Sphingosinicella soli]
MTEPLRLLGAPGSPYTRKLIALLRYRRIPYAILWGSHVQPPADLPAPKVKLLPTAYFPLPDGTLDPVVDSSPIIRRLEAEHSGREAVPANAVLAFLNHLIEDYADEWLTKAMFHYRWAFAEDAANAAPLLVFWMAPTMPTEAAAQAADMFADRQIRRLYVVGSNEATGETIEHSYRRFLGILDALIAGRGYVLGARPSSADFAIHGQLAQLAVIEPTSTAIAAQTAPRVRAWLDRVEDLSGVEPGPSDWFSRAEMSALRPLLSEIGRVYAPFLMANEKAVMAGAETVQTEIDGRPWAQPVFPYQAKCLQWIREAFAALVPDDQTFVRSLLDGTGCERLLP